MSSPTHDELAVAELSRIGSRRRRFAPPRPPHMRRACGRGRPTRRSAAGAFRRNRRAYHGQPSSVAALPSQNPVQPYEGSPISTRLARSNAQVSDLSYRSTGEGTTELARLAQLTIHCSLPACREAGHEVIDTGFGYTSPSLVMTPVLPSISRDRSERRRRRAERSQVAPMVREMTISITGAAITPRVAFGSPGSSA